MPDGSEFCTDPRRKSENCRGKYVEGCRRAVRTTGLKGFLHLDLGIIRIGYSRGSLPAEELDRRCWGPTGDNPMNTRTLATALAGATLFGLTAAQAAPKPKANRAGAVTVTVTNSRKADLVQLEAAKSGSADWKEVLGPLKSGKQASAKLPQASDCRFDLRGTFDDGESMDASGINVCADKKLNLTD